MNLNHVPGSTFFTVVDNPQKIEKLLRLLLALSRSPRGMILSVEEYRLMSELAAAYPRKLLEKVEGKK